MTRRMTTLVLPVLLGALALTGCGGEKPSSDATSASPSSASAPPTPSVSRTATPSAEPSEELEDTEAPVAEETAAEQTDDVAGDAELQQFFRTGGQCISDVWSSSMTYTEALQQKVIDYCAANQLGDWAHGVDPMDPKNYGGGEQGTAVKSEAEQAEDIAQCNALDIYTASSGAIQYCYMEYGITPPGAPAEDAEATPDVAGP